MQFGNTTLGVALLIKTISEVYLCVIIDKTKSNARNGHLLRHGMTCDNIALSKKGRILFVILNRLKQKLRINRKVICHNVPSNPPFIYICPYMMYRFHLFYCHLIEAMNGGELNLGLPLDNHREDFHRRESEENKCNKNI